MTANRSRLFPPDRTLRFPRPGPLRGSRRAGRGFTLIELMVAMVIVVALVAISIPIFLRARSSARSTECVSNVRQLGGALLSHAMEHGGKLIPLQPAVDRDTGKRPPIWTVQLARDGYLWDGEGELPCGKGVWTCPECDYMSHTYGGYGVAEDSVFVYEENRPRDASEPGSLRLNKIAQPERTWLVGDATRSANEPNKGWYAIWSRPDRWGSHSPAPRHRGKVHVCLADGSVVVLTLEEIEKRELTENVVR
jgi:prepilin-type N-terminal cleavage/methylation domain-containing protein/prepilin-type processing-associated H-X9-DG protein